MLSLDGATRREMWQHVVRAIEIYTNQIGMLRVAPVLDLEEIRERLAPFEFKTPMAPLEAVEFAVRNLRQFQVHTLHSRYFGLFNPAPTAMGIAADFLVAAFNPQLAAWSHSPFAAEVEQHLIRAFGRRFGYEQTDGTFASGGAEANHTAVLTALTHAFPDYGKKGTRALPSDPVFYISADGHHSFAKAARLCGIGTDAVREIPVDEDLRMDPARLGEAICGDRRGGRAPFLVVATAGTTGTGVVDPIGKIAVIAAREKLWLHVDAAWGGAAAIVPELRESLAGIERADSITFDGHKWLSVPMGAGIFLTRHLDILRRTFSFETGYMPRDAAGLDVADPYAHSMQWSRRFIGLKVFLSLAVAGWEGYEEAIRHQTEMGDLLRRELASHGWEIANKTPFPLVCFVDPRGADSEAIVRAVVGSGKAWISTARAGSRMAIRACVTNYRTGPADIAALVEAVGAARRR